MSYAVKCPSCSKTIDLWDIAIHLADCKKSKGNLMPNNNADYHIKEALKSVELALTGAKGQLRAQLERAIERLARAQMEMRRKDDAANK